MELLSRGNESLPLDLGVCYLVAHLFCIQGGGKWTLRTWEVVPFQDYLLDSAQLQNMHMGTTLSSSCPTVLSIR